MDLHNRLKNLLNKKKFSRIKTSGKREVLKSSSESVKEFSIISSSSDVRTKEPEKSIQDSDAILSKKSIEEIELINAFNLRVIDRFESHRYSYSFEPDISNSIKWRLFRCFEGFLFDEEYLYLPRKLQENSFDKWFTIGDFSFLKNDVKLQVQFINSNCDRKLIIKELLLKTSSILKETYFSSVKPTETCEELLLNTYPGYVVSVKNLESEDGKSLAVLAIVCKKTVAISNVYDRMMIFKGSFGYRSLFNKNLLRRRVISKHTGKTYIIIDSDPNINAITVMSRCSEDNEITFKSFYETNFGLRTIHDDQPILFCRSNASSSKLLGLLPEFCELVPEDISFIPSEISCRERFYRFIRIVNQDESIQNLFNAWGFSFTMNHCTTNLSNFNMQKMKKNFIFSPISSQFMDPQWFSKRWSKFYRQPYSKPITEGFKAWGLITPPIRQCRRVIQGFMNSIQTVAKETNIQIGNPEHRSLPDNPSPLHYIELIEDLYYGHDLGFVIVVMKGPCRDDEVYKVMKKYCAAIEFPLQVVFLSTLDCAEFFLNDITGNIINQINCKLGGIPWVIKMPFDHVMFVGVHLYEDVIAFSANTSQNSETWLFETRFLESQFDTNILNETKHLGNFIFTSSEKYFEKNNRFPMQIVIIHNFEGYEEERVQKCVSSEIEIVGYVLKQIILQYNCSKLDFVDSDDSAIEYFYLATCDNFQWSNEKDPRDGMNMILSLMSPYFTTNTIFPVLVRLCYPRSLPIRDCDKLESHRIKTMEDLQLALIIQSHLYFNSATFSALPAVCMNARKLAVYSKNVIGKDVNASEDFSFL